MSTNANQQQQITPAQAVQLLTELAALPTLKLSLAEHGAIQQALAVLADLVKPKPAEELTVVPEPDTN